MLAPGSCCAVQHGSLCLAQSQYMFRDAPCTRMRNAVTLSPHSLCQVASMHRAPAALTSAQLSTWPWPSQRVQHTSFLRLPLRKYSSCQWQVASSARLAANIMTCRRCKQQFTAADNTSSSCRYHPSLFSGGEVAKAIGFVRASDAPEDQLERVVGRKGLLRFWDCCGMEDEAAPGCCVGFHVTYDAEVNEAHAWE